MFFLLIRFPSERQPRSCSSRKPLKNQRPKPLNKVPCHDGSHTKQQRRKPFKNVCPATMETIKNNPLPLPSDKGFLSYRAPAEVSFRIAL